MSKVGTDNPELDRQTLEYFFNAVDWQFAVISADGRVKTANLAFRRFTGPAGGAYDAKLAAMLTQGAAETYETASTMLSPGRPIKGLRLTFRIGRDELTVHADLQRAENGDTYYCARDRTNENRTEQERVEAFDNLSRLEDVMGIGRWRITLDGAAEWSKGMYPLFGLDADSGPPSFEQFQALIHADDLPALKEVYKLSRNTGGPLQIRYRITTPAGAVRVIEVAGSASRNVNGEIVGVHGVAIDRTHAACNGVEPDVSPIVADNATAAADEHAPVSRSVQPALASMVWETNIKERQHRVEGAWPSFTESSPPVDFFPKTFIDSIPEADREAVREAWRAHISDSAAFEIQHGFIGPDGEVIQVETSVELARDEETGRPVKIFGMMTKLQSEGEGSETRDQEDLDIAMAAPLSILVAEDNPMVQRIISTLLTPLGMNVEIVGDGAAAVEAVKNNRFDAVVMDMKMPILDGVEATRRIRVWEEETRACGPVPVFALTSDISDERKLQALSAGVTDFLDKPLRLEQLCVLLSRSVETFVCNLPECA